MYLLDLRTLCGGDKAGDVLLSCYPTEPEMESHMPEEEISVVDPDFVVDLILEFLEIHIEISPDIPPVGDIVEGDLPFVDRLEVLATSVEVRDTVARKVSEAQAAGNAFPLPNAQDLAAARERRLAR